MRLCKSLLALMLSFYCLGAVRADEPDTYSTVKDLEKMRKQRQLSSQNIWWEHLIPGRIEGKKQAQLQAKADANKDKKKADDKDTVASKPVEQPVRQVELSKALRREAVCQRLREIAEETRDPELAKQADLLESRAWALYEQKMTSVNLNRLQSLSEKDIETKLLKSERSGSGESARAETDSIRSIRGEKKE